MLSGSTRQIRYNQKRVDNFSKMRIRRMIFRAWKGYFRIQLKIRDARRKRCVDLTQMAFNDWYIMVYVCIYICVYNGDHSRCAVSPRRKETAQKQHSLRLLTYNNWKGYARLLMQGPFQSKTTQTLCLFICVSLFGMRAAYALSGVELSLPYSSVSCGGPGWAEYVKGIKNRFNEELRIALSYRRWKTRQKMLKIMKTWRHQGHTHPHTYIHIYIHTAQQSTDLQRLENADAFYNVNIYNIIMNGYLHVCTYARTCVCEHLMWTFLIPIIVPPAQPCSGAWTACTRGRCF